MARILLGVTGGIAAYKALELVRLATKAGHAVRVDPDAEARRASSAPRRSPRSPARRCSPTSSSATRLRGAFPGQAPPDHDPLSHLELVAQRRRLR